MVIRRVSCIEAGSPGLHIFSKFPAMRLGAVLLSTILRERGCEVKAFIEDVAGVFGKTSIHKALKWSPAYLHEADVREK
jgi:hypothetical protein